MEWLKFVALYKQTVGLKRINPSLKIMLAVGRWNRAGKGFSPMICDILGILY